MSRGFRSLPAFLGRAALLALLATAPLGCGSPPVVEGSVTYDGKAVDNGLIVFQPEDRTKPATSADIQNGGYRTDPGRSPEPGTYIVSIEWNRKTGRQLEAPGDPGNKIDEVEQMIPPKHNTASTKKIEIRGGVNKHDFALEK